MARQETTLPSSLHAHIGFMAEPSGALVRPHQPTGHQARFVRQRRPIGQDDRGVHREPQCLCLPLRLGRDGGVDLRQTRTSICAYLRDITLLYENRLRGGTAGALRRPRQGLDRSSNEPLFGFCLAGPLPRTSAQSAPFPLEAEDVPNSKLYGTRVPRRRCCAHARSRPSLPRRLGSVSRRACASRHRQIMVTLHPDPEVCASPAERFEPKRHLDRHRRAGIQDARERCTRDPEPPRRFPDRPVHRLDALADALARMPRSDTHRWAIGSRALTDSSRHRIRYGGWPAAAQRQSSPRLTLIASKGRMPTCSSSFALATRAHSPSRNSNASIVRSARSTSHRCSTPSRA